MLDRETLAELDDVAGRLLRLVDDRTDAGDRAGALPRPTLPIMCCCYWISTSSELAPERSVL